MEEMSASLPILVSNIFPFSLIRRRVIVEPSSENELRTALLRKPFVSSWGHANTAKLAGAISGVDLRPATDRPALTLDEDLYPQLDGESFRECWLISPVYVPGFRPAANAEVSSETITSWQILRLDWD